MTDKTFVATPLTNNLDAVCGHVCDGCCKKAAVAAAKEVAIFEKAAGPEDAMSDLQADIHDFMTDRIKQYGIEHELDGWQMTGLAFQVAHNFQVHQVDEMRKMQHPLLRLVYLHTLQRALVANTAIATLAAAGREGYIEGPLDPLVVKQLEQFTAAMDEPMPLAIIQEFCNEADDEKIINTPNAEIPDEAMTALQGLVNLLPPGPLRDDAQGRLDKLIGKINGAEPAAIKDPDEVSDNEIADAILAKLNATGVPITREQLLAGITAARKEDGNMVVIKLPKAE